MRKKIVILGSTGSIGKTTLNIIKKDIKKFKTLFVPVDSEHFSIWSLLNNNKIDAKYKSNKIIQNIIITASGGPFLKTKINQFKQIKC